MPNLRYTALGRPHILHRRLRRVENLATSLALAIFDLLATKKPAGNVDEAKPYLAKFAQERLAPNCTLPSSG